MVISWVMRELACRRSVSALALIANKKKTRTWWQRGSMNLPRFARLAAGNGNRYYRGATSRIAHLEKLRKPKLFTFVVCNPWQSSPSLTILVSLRFNITSLAFFYFIKPLFSQLGFLQSVKIILRGQNKRLSSFNVSCGYVGYYVHSFDISQRARGPRSPEGGISSGHT